MTNNFGLLNVCQVNKHNMMDCSFSRICKILRIKPNRYLLLLSSSYVIIVFGTKTFTNSLELALVSLLLWRVVDSLSVSEKVSKLYFNYRDSLVFKMYVLLLGFSC